MTTLEHKLAEGFIHEMMKHAADPVVPTGPIPTTPVIGNTTKAPSSAPMTGQQFNESVFSELAKWMTPETKNNLIKSHLSQPGALQGLVNKHVDENLRGFTKVEGDKVTLDKANIIPHGMKLLGNWIGKNPGTAMLGAGGLLGGGMLLSSMFSGNNNNQQQGQPQSITPQGYQPPKTTFNKFSVANDEDIRQYVLNSIYDSN